MIWKLLFPTRCPVCDRIVKPFGEKICLECLPKLRTVTPPWCMKCGKKIQGDEELCMDCRGRKHMFDRARTLYEYGTLRLSIALNTKEDRNTRISTERKWKNT